MKGFKEMQPYLKQSLGGAGLALLLTTAAVLPAAAAPLNYDTPQEAVSAVVAALQAQDKDGLIQIFGAENEDVILTGNEGDDRQTWSEFLRDYKSLNRITTDDAGDSATLLIGRDLWPFPASIVKDGSGWHFDAESAREEVRLRRIGQNELDVIDLMHGYVRAQAAYRAEDPDGDGLRTFADALISEAGKRDGLYWPDEPGAPESPVGDFMARAAAGGYNFDGTDAEPEPYLGYYYRVLTRQGAAAPGGAMDYMVNGHMAAGHALLAFPADYGDTGVMSFMVGEDDVVYQADLGEDTLTAADAIESFDPGDGWTPVSADDSAEAAGQ